jgi:hypothetical protein
MNKLLVNLMLCVTLALPAVCNSVPMVSELADAASKQFQLPPSDVAGVYIYRNSGLMGKNQAGAVWLDGQFQGNLPDETYFYLQTAPGAHTFSSQAAPGENDLHFEVRAGENHFFSQVFVRKVPVVGALPLVGSVVGAFVSTAKFEVVSEETGKDGVLACQQAALRNGSIAGALAITQPDCISALESDPELKPISKKVALGGKEDNLFSLMAIDQRPTQSERKAIVKWGSKRERCFNSNPPPRDANYQLSVDTFNRGQKLLLELSKGEITYGQFAERRKEIKETSLAKARSIQVRE